MRYYYFAKSFSKNFQKNTSIKLTKKDMGYILRMCGELLPYRKVDNKGRDTEYFTFPFNDYMITIICDAPSGKILTGILEVHYRKKFYFPRRRNSDENSRGNFFMEENNGDKNS